MAPMKQSKVLQALNDHVSLELRAWYDYSAMALWLEINDLPGCASFMKKQAAEEMAHAHRIIHHLLDRDVTPRLPAIDAPSMDYASVKQVFEKVLAAEQAVTRSIHAVHVLATSEDDQPARILLEWFITEQVEEESMARAILGRIRLAGETGPGLLLVDQELGSGSVPGVAPAAE
jgi:ferritin